MKISFFTQEIFLQKPNLIFKLPISQCDFTLDMKIKSPTGSPGPGLVTTLTGDGLKGRREDWLVGAGWPWVSASCLGLAPAPVLAPGQDWHCHVNPGQPVRQRNISLISHLPATSQWVSSDDINCPSTSCLVITETLWEPVWDRIPVLGAEQRAECVECWVLVLTRSTCDLPARPDVTESGRKAAQHLVAQISPL